MRKARETAGLTLPGWGTRSSLSTCCARGLHMPYPLPAATRRGQGASLLDENTRTPEGAWCWGPGPQSARCSGSLAAARSHARSPCTIVSVSHCRTAYLGAVTALDCLAAHAGGTLAAPDRASDVKRGLRDCEHALWKRSDPLRPPRWGRLSGAAPAPTAPL